MKVGDTVKLQYQTKPGCLPEIATVLNTWWGHRGIVQYIEIHCPKLGGDFTVRADLFIPARVTDDTAVYNIPTTNQ